MNKPTVIADETKEFTKEQCDYVCNMNHDTESRVVEQPAIPPTTDEILLQILSVLKSIEWELKDLRKDAADPFR